MEDHLAVICPANGYFYQGKQFSIDEFRRQKFLLREHGSGTRETFDRTIEAAGFSIVPAWEAMSTTALVNAVINGLGITVLPYRMVIGPLEHGLIVSASVEGLSFKRKYQIIYTGKNISHHQLRLLSTYAVIMKWITRSHVITVYTKAKPEQ